MFSMMLLVTAVIFWWLVFRVHSLSVGFALMRRSPLTRCIMLGLLIFFLIFVSGGLMAYTQTLFSVRPSHWENKTSEIQGLFSNQLQLSLIDKHQHNAFVRLYGWRTVAPSQWHLWNFQMDSENKYLCMLSKKNICFVSEEYSTVISNRNLL